MRDAGTERMWDSYDAYLFDIDGTLLNCRDAVHYFAFLEALKMLSGRELNLDGVVAHGNTDVGILRDALRLAGVPDASWRPRLPEAQQAMCSHVDRHRHTLQIETLPCVRAVLDHLQARGAVLGVATGNLAGIGKIKLDTGGLLPYFHFGGYSDAFETRRDVFAAARQQARDLAGSGASVCVFGDTPVDVEAAHSNGLPVIAVATGIYPRERLLLDGPEICLDTLCGLLHAADQSN